MVPLELSCSVGTWIQALCSADSRCVHLSFFHCMCGMCCMMLLSRKQLYPQAQS
jgi:hypothetical protein